MVLKGHGDIKNMRCEEKIYLNAFAFVPKTFVLFASERSFLWNASILW